MKSVLILALLALAGCTPSNYTCIELTVTKVGGCNKSGYCGVMYSNGETGGEYMPVEGGKAQVCSSKN